jgi:hypothetical protein
MRMVRFLFILLATRPGFELLYYASSSSSAYYNPLLAIGLANIPPSRSIFGYSHPAPASRPAQIVLCMLYTYNPSS